MGDPSDKNGDDLYRALKWQVEAGADEALGEAPADRFAESTRPAPSPAQAPPRPAPAPAAAAAKAPPPAPGPAQKQSAAPPSEPAAPISEAPRVEAPVGDASVYEMVAEAKTMEELGRVLESFDGCPLRQTATNTCFYDGSTDARIVFVGEAPGAEEDRQGKPFVGAAGKLLDRMLESIGLDRTSVLITNTIFWRPPGNRNPTPGEIAACLPFVERVVEIMDPAVLVMVGGVSAKTLMGTKDGIMKLRGKWVQFETPRMARPVPAMPLYHPAFLLRSPGQKRAAWRDLLEIKKRLAEATAKG